VCFEVGRELTRLGIGEALVTALNPKGIPMPTVRTMMRPPMSLMAQLDPAAFAAVVAASPIAPRYATDQDPDSAAEAIARDRKQARTDAPAQEPMSEVRPPSPAPRGGAKRPTRAPERGVDWGEVAEEGARFARSGAFNAILRGILRFLGGRR
jgi:hypothetical protein